MLGPTLTIDRQALRHNYERVRAFAPGCAILAMLKANAYGHGLVDVATTLQHADAFGLARCQEALTLRQAGFEQRLVVMAGFADDDELDFMAQFTVDAVIHHEQQVHRLEKVSLSRLSQPIVCWLKVDSGMHRMGFLPERVMEIYQRLNRLTAVAEVKLISHFANADDLNNPQSRQQYQQFLQCTQTIKAEKSAANSAAIITYPESHLDWVRPGLMLYGASPILGKTAADYDLRLAMRLQSSVIAINHYQAGDPIGYGSTYHCPQEMAVAVLAMGYGDGYPRHAATGTPVWLNGQCCPVVGRVSMDTLSVSLQAAKNINIGDEAVFWGAELPIELIATQATTIPYELFTSMTRRVQVKYL